jgi:dTDP-4-dehydrorhamnose 3,5-epimerase
MSVEVSAMAVSPTEIHGLMQIDIKSVTDERGTVREFFRSSDCVDMRLPVPDRWAQVNLTWTRRGALRGLHGEQMTKLVGVASGEAFGVYVDARTDSPTFGTVVTVPLAVGRQMLVPPGVCNGFQAVSGPGCQYLYCFDAEWRPGMAGVSINPLDPGLGVPWPIAVDPGDPAMVSRKDIAAPPLTQPSREGKQCVSL